MSEVKRVSSSQPDIATEMTTGVTKSLDEICRKKSKEHTDRHDDNGVNLLHGNTLAYNSIQKLYLNINGAIASQVHLDKTNKTHKSLVGSSIDVVTRLAITKPADLNNTVSERNDNNKKLATHVIPNIIQDNKLTLENDVSSEQTNTFSKNDLLQLKLSHSDVKLNRSDTHLNQLDKNGIDHIERADKLFSFDNKKVNNDLKNKSHDSDNENIINSHQVALNRNQATPHFNQGVTPNSLHGAEKNAVRYSDVSNVSQMQDATAINNNKLTYAFSEWGKGHQVNIHLASNNAAPMVLQPSDPLVHQRLSDHAGEQKQGQPEWVFSEDAEKSNDERQKSHSHQEEESE